jgi:riboflavin biosynthesis pyrimidine reductase
MATVDAFEALFHADGLPRFNLPEPIERLYGPFGLPDEVVYANFVATVDGVAVLPGVAKSSPLVSRGHPADRFTVALLRAFADAVVIGAGTFRAHDGPWTADRAYPDCADAFGQLRSEIGASPRPVLVVVSWSGAVRASEEKLRNTLVVTTPTGKAALSGMEAEGFEVVDVAGSGRIDPTTLLAVLAERGFRRVLTEGGPRLMGDLVDAGAVDELFLTVAPQLAGSGHAVPRLGIAGGVDILPDRELMARLLEVRRNDSYLFLRYSLRDEATIRR